MWPTGSLRDEFRQQFVGGGPQLRDPQLVYTSLDRYRLQTAAMGTVSKLSQTGTVDTVSKLSQTGSIDTVSKLSQTGTMDTVSKLSQTGTMDTVSKLS